MKPTKNCLVLYKQTPAQVLECGNKLDICVLGGKTRSVREKDVFVLHPGPVQTLEFEVLEGHAEEAWELLQNENPSLEELADLVYGEFTPSTAWQAFKLLNRTPWFKGTPDAIEVCDPEKVKDRIRIEKEKIDAEKRWNDFIERFREKNIHPEKDEIFLRDLEIYALGRSKGSRILKAFGKTQKSENAHRMMINYGVKKETWNPHPLRLNVPLELPDYPIGDMPNDTRLDLTAMDAFAIDDEGNQDPDDALAWDGERFWVHVADVAALFPAGSPADEFASERSSSLYLPEKTVPMLPPKVAQSLGLGLHETSPALSYAFSFDEYLNVTNFSVHLTRIRVKRLTYTQADALLVEEPFSTMKKITDAAAKRREKSGAISIKLPKVKIHVDSEEQIFITPISEMGSREMVAEAMILAGAHVARLCQDKGIPIPFATQDISEEVSLLTEKKVSGEKDSQIDYVTEFNRRRGMKRSRITLECSSHRGLGLDAYTRITSPLRRYPDLVSSRQIRHYILGEELEDVNSIRFSLAVAESRTGSLIQAERQSNFFWKLQWLKRHPSYTAEAWLLDRRERQGLFLIPEIAMEVQITIKKEMKIGEHVILKLKGVDIPESSVLFLIQERLNSTSQ